ncbi:hypothetical protein J2Y69_001398 [Microbacterium resistens]|uniref:Uncharacterized protein n=1 Tax=Microbacterium resistens TaxID=156977 RepID=A0ABU1SB23_9MICO|nr:hypothetical protein [Microbacterium resistens]
MPMAKWHITTGDPEVAAKVHELLGGDGPQEWASKGEDNIEVFTASSTVDIIIEKAKDLRQRMVLWGRSGKPIYVSDGEHLLDDQGHPTEERDPDADLSFAERKAKKDIGAIPDIDLFFRLADEPDLGVFKFKTGSWGFASDLAYNGVESELGSAEGPVKATLTLSPVSFVAKNGPRKGQTVSYTKSELVIKGAA